MLLLIAASWLISLVLGGLPILGWNCLGDLEACSTVLLYAKPYVLCVVTIFSVILSAIVALYIRIYCVVRSSQADVAAPQTACPAQDGHHRAGCLYHCWLPAFSILLLDYACPVRACLCSTRPTTFYLRHPQLAAEPGHLHVGAAGTCGGRCYGRCSAGGGRQGGARAADRTPGHHLLPLRSSSSWRRACTCPPHPHFWRATQWCEGQVG